MGSIYKVNETYYASYNDCGRRVRVSLKTKDKDTADRRLALLENEAEHDRLLGITPAPTPKGITLKEFSRSYLEWHKSEYPDSHFRTEGVFRNHILPAFGKSELTEISPFLVEKWKAQRRQDEASPATIKKELDALKAALNRAVKWELMPTNRVAAVSPPKLLESRPPRFYTADELRAIYTHAKLYGQLWKFVANTGMRRAEIMKARRRDIVGGYIRIMSTSKDRTKSGKWRPVPLSPGALAALPHLGEDYLAPQMAWGQSISRAFVNDAEAAGVGGRLHDLRHTFCSMLVMSGVDLRTVQELAGHKSYETTLRYAHLSEQHLTKAVINLDI